MGIPWKQQLPYPLVHTTYLKTIPQSTPLRTQSSLLNLVNYHLDPKTNIRDHIIIRIEINLTETETMIGSLKPQETTPEVTLEGNTPRIIETSLPTTLKIGNIIQETHQEVTPEGNPQTLNIGHIVEMKIHMVKGINHKKETLHILGKEIIAKIETTEKETHDNHETTAITGPQTIQQKKGTPHIQEEEALPETETTPELLHQALTHLQDT